MRMSQEYWYRHSSSAVRPENSTNYINLPVVDRYHRGVNKEYIQQQKAASKNFGDSQLPKEVTMIQSVRRPVGLFLFDGQPLPRSGDESIAASQALLTASTWNQSILQPTKPLYSPDALTLNIEDTYPPPDQTSRKNAQGHFINSNESQRQKKSLKNGSKRNNKSILLPGDLSPAALPKVPIADRYYNRLSLSQNIPKKHELTVLYEAAQRKDIVKSLKHIYRDDRFTRHPVACDDLVRFYLPSLKQERSLERQWHVDKYRNDRKVLTKRFYNETFDNEHD